MNEDRLTIDGLSVSFRDGGAWRRVVHGASMEVRAGRATALVGESGSGKSVTAMSVLGLLPPRASRLDAGRIELTENGVVTALTGADTGVLRSVRGRRIAMIFQEPMTALNPVMTVGRQIEECAERAGLRGRDARRAALDALASVGVDEPTRRRLAYPHELSGGQRQRVLIASALVAGAKWILADEPTTALDVTVQRQILELLAQLREERGMGMLFITHALPVAAAVADAVVVMVAGRVVETGPARETLLAPRHPYTRSLVAASPALGAPARHAGPDWLESLGGADGAWGPREGWGEPEMREVAPGRRIAVRAGFAGAGGAPGVR
ncbi:MAG: ABC transporter ATP-binding protein [Phycisphaerales bacterium]|nr:ABC transporter ATP-binding protein [Phycisphaerales bacterium]